MLVMSTFEVTKHTKMGVWIDVYGSKKFVLKDSHKRYACPTIEEALVSYQARKSRQIRILTHKLATAKAALELKPDSNMSYIDSQLGQ